ncbi:tyrosine-protein phosphatase [Candidatus Phycosocius spiralis]|uniref:Tyrosine phosphatase n=1 Tax=Candidatus Phycosocius spiralis TaxID=2815099 RepID=A0ABQ4PTB6_9PROT|nr:tyrosine-protein phosphatase [Candidatus Phycosocius spiralis]GIU66262.1 tyrosine phosphatase [Candidatus Phycosocius spiralis]
MDRRSFLVSAGCAGALSLPVAADAATPITATAVRLDAGKVRLNWSDKAAKATLRVADAPDKPAVLMRTLVKGAGGGQAEVAAPTTPRPYFLIDTGWGRQVRVAERLLPLQCGRNFRDLGGYQTQTGQAVKWGKLYRSGVMSNLSRSDISYLAQLGIAIICDLRSQQERTSEPSQLLASDAIKTLAHDYEMQSSLASLLRAKTRAEAVNIFSEVYLNFATMLAPQYTEMFASMLENKGPLVVNCTAGKDRTGVASALILSVLGVRRETVIADYALSQTYVPVSYYLNLAQQAGSAPTGTAAQTSPFARLLPEVATVILGSDAEVMRKALAQMDTQFGGPIGLVKQRFGLSDAAIKQLRALYVA